jgi:hypothetical protein
MRKAVKIEVVEMPTTVFLVAAYADGKESTITSGRTVKGMQSQLAYWAKQHGLTRAADKMSAA